jgi:hypothetical protein
MVNQNLGKQSVSLHKVLMKHAKVSELTSDSFIMDMLCIFANALSKTKARIMVEHIQTVSRLTRVAFPWFKVPDCLDAQHWVANMGMEEIAHTLFTCHCNFYCATSRPVLSFPDWVVYYT